MWGIYLKLRRFRRASKNRDLRIITFEKKKNEIINCHSLFRRFFLAVSSSSSYQWLQKITNESLKVRKRRCRCFLRKKLTFHGPQSNFEWQIYALLIIYSESVSEWLTSQQRICKGCSGIKELIIDYIKKEEKTLTASQVDCFSWIWIVLNFLWMIFTWVIRELLWGSW